MTRSSIRTTGLSSRVVLGDERLVGGLEIGGVERGFADLDAVASDLEDERRG